MARAPMPRSRRRRSPVAAPRAALGAAALAAGLLAAAGAAAPARATIEEAYAPGQPPVTTTWFAPVSEAAQRADREYVAGMRPHHAGALTMSAEYLRDPGRSSPLLQQLSRAIVANQTFEIEVLDEVQRNLDARSVRLPFGVRVQPVATEGLTGKRRFFKEPMPSPASYAVGPVSEADVRFAKAMIIHHDAAVEMAREYHANPDARNGFLGLMNVDIITDQTQEIALMRRVIAAFPGNADAVVVDASMVHGMEGMRHGGGGHRHAAAAPGGGGANPAATAAGTGAAHAHHGDHRGHGATPAAGAPAEPAARPAPPRPHPPPPAAQQRPPQQRPAAAPPAAAGHAHHHHHNH